LHRFRNTGSDDGGREVKNRRIVRIDLGDGLPDLRDFLSDLNRCGWDVEILALPDIFLMRGDPVPQFFRANSLLGLELAEIANQSFKDIRVGPIDFELVHFLRDSLRIQIKILYLIQLYQILLHYRTEECQPYRK
jgi:hypothetical protein